MQFELDEHEVAIVRDALGTELECAQNQRDDNPDEDSGEYIKQLEVLVARFSPAAARKKRHGSN